MPTWFSIYLPAETFWQRLIRYHFREAFDERQAFEAIKTQKVVANADSVNQNTLQVVQQAKWRPRICRLHGHSVGKPKHKARCFFQNRKRQECRQGCLREGNLERAVPDQLQTVVWMGHHREVKHHSILKWHICIYAQFGPDKKESAFWLGLGAWRNGHCFLQLLTEV